MKNYADYIEAKDFLMGYSFDEENNELVEFYEDGHKRSIPATIHNLDIIDRKLLGQFDFQKEHDFIDYKLSSYYDCFLMAVDLSLVVVSCNKGIVIPACFFAYRLIHNAICLYKDSYGYNTLKLIEYCFDNSNIVSSQLESDPDTFLKGFNEEASMILREDGEFSLNNSECYTKSELKLLKKKINRCKRVNNED